jgi:hypothetical protein
MFAKFTLLATLVVCVSVPMHVHAVTLQVNCDQPTSKLPTINSALKMLSGPVASVGTNTIQVVGACNENIAVDGLSNLTLTANNGASITDASGGTAPVIQVQRTTNFHLDGFAIRGGGGPLNAAITCIWTSTCYLSGNDVQSPGHVAINTAFGSFISLNHDMLEQSLIGLFLHSSRAELVTVTLRNNTGVGLYAIESAFAAVAFSSAIDHNLAGVLVTDHSTVEVDDSAITANNGNGMIVQSGSEVRFATVTNAGSTISGNNGRGLVIDDLSFANFQAGNTAVFGNAVQPDVACQGHFSAMSRNAVITGTTNCPP